MSFLCEKDVLKRGGSSAKKPLLAAQRSDGKKPEDVVERAKIEREQRKLLREHAITANRIQAWWRGRCASHRCVFEIRKSAEKKIIDIESLSQILQQKGVSFVPPVPIAFELCKLLLAFGVHGISDIIMLLRLCKSVLMPTLSQPDQAKNIAMLLLNDDVAPCHWANRLCSAILTACSSKTKAGITQQQICSYLIPTLRLTVGGGLQFTVTPPADLTSAFASIRFSLTKRIHLFRFVRELLTRISDPYVNAVNNDESSIAGSGTFCTKRPASAGQADQLVELCMFFVQADRDFVDSRLGEFCRELFAVPLLTVLLSEQTLRTFCQWDLFGRCLEYVFSRPQIALPPSPHYVFTSGQWLLGNFASLAAFMTFTDKPTNKSDPSPIVSSSHPITITTTASSATAISDEILQMYLNTCASLLQRYEVPGVLQGRNGVVWTKSGASLTAAGVPRALQEQVLSLLHPSFSSSLCCRILLPLRHDVRLSPITRSEDRTEVNNALASSGLQIAQATIQEGQEASRWFTSKWATKMMSSVTRSLGVDSVLSTSSSSASKRPADGAAASDDMDTNTNLAGTSEWYTLPSCPYVTNPKSIAALANLWALILPPAGAASVDSLAWRLVSSIAFATHASDRLWVAVLLLCGDNLEGEGKSTYAEANNATAKTVSAAPTKEGEIGSSSGGDKSGGGLGISKMFSYLIGGGSSSSIAPSTQASSSAGGLSKRAAQNGVEAFFMSRFDPKSDLQSTSLDGKVAAIVALAAVLRMLLAALDDSELYDGGKPLPLSQFLRIVRVFKIILYKTIRGDPNILIDPTLASDRGDRDRDKTDTERNVPSDANTKSGRNIELMYRYDAVRAISAVLSDIYLRWARRPFSTSSLWEIEDTDSISMRRELQQQSPFAVAILRCMPWSINFHQRMKIFRDVIDGERASVQGGTSDDPFSPLQQRSRGVVVRVRRTNILLDGMAALEKVGSSIKDRVVIRYLNSFGEEEAGIDIGGLFKDFLTDLSVRVFDPSYGLFSLTSNNLLYPNPAATILYPESNELEKLYSFLGRVLGKALFENITLQPQFAHFFLAFMHGRYNFMNLVNDLGTLDQELYKNLMFLKSYEGDIGDLSLTFSVNDDAMGATKEIELLPGGSRMAVTSKNRHRYINLVAKHYLHDRLKRQARAFFSGLYEVIQPDLLSIFCAPELQVLISGATSGVSLEDLKRNTRYAGGYASVDRHVTRFWAVVDELEEEDVRRLVKFVTSCERPPSLGFSALHPPFTIQRVECADDQRLPTASTCFNILKMPTYSSQSVLKDRLLTSIRSGAGFDLS